ncbi:HNH endonuclease [Paeniglutamicibacter cryotolerans]|uniref:HNH nuclease domain-containing protein n=1 Tax=Paeniglutamicibacter cryotolerans TaxID=670079 RepID=A0A839QL60_9MICC|nr:HNH endonuclease signature motif containing protein [Paeniglutamicibacter cryotolerans]MBB2995504.1 hypothetical protein [Paeniglutamicibacter cryotolerans]
MVEEANTRVANRRDLQGKDPGSTPLGRERTHITAFAISVATLAPCGSERELIELLTTTERAKAALAALEARTAAALDTARRTRHARAGLKKAAQGRGIGTEIALARHEAPAEGRRHLKCSRILTDDLPSTMDRFTQGSITEEQAMVIAHHLRKLTPAARTRADERLNEDPGLFTGEGVKALGNRVRALAQELDPRDPLARAETARGQRHLAIYPAPDAMMKVTGMIPVEAGLLINQVLDDLADSLTATGAAQGRTRIQLRTDEFCSLLTGTRTTVPRVEINLVMSERTLFRGSREPAHLTGYGTVPADWARAMIHGPDAVNGEAVAERWIRRLYTAPHAGELIGMDSRRRLFPAGLARFITARDRCCRTPGCNARIRDIDHVFGWALGGLTTQANGQGCCKACNLTKETPGWSTITVPGARHAVETTTPTGATYRSTAPPPPGI